mgnify:CR=1 FL=1
MSLAAKLAVLLRELEQHLNQVKTFHRVYARIHIADAPTRRILVSTEESDLG